MHRGLWIIALAFSLAFSCGCATTDDPTSGGLFSYDPAAYERRLAERQTRLDELKKQQTLEEEKSEEMKKSIALKKAEQEAMAKKIAALEEETALIEQKIRSSKLVGEELEHQGRQINDRLKALKKELHRVKSTPLEDEENKKKLVEELKRKIDQLLIEAEDLSKM